jgi:alpha,alpha-trehalase
MPCLTAISLFLAVGVATPGIAADAAGQVKTPSQLYGQLFDDVQMQRVFPDSKTFVDAIAKDAPAIIVHRYHEERGKPGFDLAAFVARNFTVQRPPASGYHSIPGQDVCSHIDALWSVLARRPDRADPRSSLLPLPYPYVVPGGRFDEIYYWDSYFTMLGLAQSGRHDMALNMARNFLSLITRYGHIPNGNRTYYLSRSQPPFFAAMVELIADQAREPGPIYAEFLNALAEEYAFWMDGAGALPPGNAHRRVVRLKDGTLLNRYWDDREVPREESYREDVKTAKAARRPAREVYRNLRAAAESGWDFSSRWFEDGRTLSTIRTTELVPVDLNSLMVQLETTLAKAYAAARKPEKAAELNARAELRRAAVRRYLWDAEVGVFTDYLWRDEEPSGTVTVATLAPLFFGLATKAQAERVAEVVRARLLKRGGLLTTTVSTGEQWDAPNAWAPLQWIAIEGLNDYGETALAETIAERWMLNVITAYRATGKLMEKYDAENPSLVTGGGEYLTQDGFGWTNGVLRKLLALYPDAVAPRPGVSWCESSPANDNVPAAGSEAGRAPAVAR